MIPIKLSLAGFLSYREPVTLDFTGFDLACISGSNGAGKSSLLDAITWVLFGQARKRDESIINTACQKAEVTLDFAYEANVYRVHRVNQRGKATTVDLFIKLSDDSGGWKTLSERTLRDTDVLIEKTLRLDYETFINASFFLQGKADQFAQQRPSDRKRILASILGLDIWEAYREQANQQRREHDNAVREVDARLSEILTELEEEATRKAHLQALQKELEARSHERQTQATAFEAMSRLAASLQEQAKMLATQKEQLDRSAQAQDRNATLLAARQTELESYQTKLAHATEIKAAYQAWLDARSQLSEWEVVASQFRKAEARRQSPLMVIESERARLTQALAHLEENAADLLKAEAEVPQLQQQLETAQAQVVTAQAGIAAREKLEADIQTLHQAQADARAENPRLKDEMKELKERISKLEQAQGATCPICGQLLSEADRLTLVMQLNEQGTSLGDRFRENQALLADFSAKLAALEAKLALSRQLDEALRNATRQADQISHRLDQIVAERATWDAGPALALAKTRKLLSSGVYAAEARTQLAEIDAELKTLGYDAAAHDAVRQAELTGREAEAAWGALNSAKAAVVPLSREIEGLQEQLEHQQEEVQRLQETYDQAAAQVAAAEAQLPDLQAAEMALLDLQEVENRLRMEVGAANQKVAVLETLRKRQAALSEERESLTRRIEQLKILERSFGKDGVPALLIEQALPEIEEQTNITLGRLSNNTMSVQFITQREFKDTSREDKKETLDIRISDGSGARDYEMFSGGEAFRVDFSIRLALSRVLAQRAGARLQTLVIDEGFGNQDAQGRQRLIEAINIVREDFAKILVITHLEELKEVFPTRIEVEKTPLGSTLVVI